MAGNGYGSQKDNYSLCGRVPRCAYPFKVHSPARSHPTRLVLADHYRARLISGLCIFFPWGAQHQTQKLIKEIDIFAFWQEAQNFLKERCARLGPWLALPAAAEHLSLIHI